MKVRFAYSSDADIIDLCREHMRPGAQAKIQLNKDTDEPGDDPYGELPDLFS